MLLHLGPILCYLSSAPALIVISGPAGLCLLNVRISFDLISDYKFVVFAGLKMQCWNYCTFVSMDINESKLNPCC